MQSEIDFYNQNGYLILPSFVSFDVCDLLKQRAHDLIEQFDMGEMKTIFSTINQNHAKQQYFLDSGDKIHFFFEEHAFDIENNLKQDKHLSINKIGHALHDLDPIFKLFSRTHKIAQLAQSLSIQDPALVQSMYICKQPLIGGEVTCHQDSTFLHVEGEPVTGLWFALEDARIENGCLWVIPGGHRQKLKSRMFRDTDSLELAIYDEAPWDLEHAIPVEVAKGSLVILHGLLPHMSKENRSNHSRHAYTLHLMSANDEFSKSNWLQTETCVKNCLI